MDEIIGLRVSVEWKQSIKYKPFDCVSLLFCNDNEMARIYSLCMYPSSGPVSNSPEIFLYRSIKTYMIEIAPNTHDCVVVRQYVYKKKIFHMNNISWNCTKSSCQPH